MKCSSCMEQFDMCSFCNEELRSALADLAVITSERDIAVSQIRLLKIQLRIANDEANSKSRT